MKKESSASDFHGTKRQVKSPKVSVRDSGLRHHPLGIRTSAGLTPSTRSAIADLGLERLAVVYPGSRPYPLAERVSVVPVTEIARRPDALFGRPGRAPRRSRA
jgi:hypothetical protein